MSQKHEIDVMVIQGADGTVHVRTPENLEDSFVDAQFSEITEGLGNVAMTDIELPEPAIETNTKAQDRDFGKIRRPLSGHPARPHKSHK